MGQTHPVLQRGHQRFPPHANLFDFAILDERIRHLTEGDLNRSLVLILISVKTTTRTTWNRKYRTRPEQLVQQTDSTVHARIDGVAVAAAKQRMGWRVYGTNHPTLRLQEVVLAYRGQYIIERGFGRLKGRALSLVPLFLHRGERVVGLICLLSLALRVLTLVEFVVRRQLVKEGAAIAGLYAGNKKRETAQPTAGRLLWAFEGISLVVVRRRGQVQAML